MHNIVSFQKFSIPYHRGNLSKTSMHLRISFFYFFFILPLPTPSRNFLVISTHIPWPLKTKQDWFPTIKDWECHARSNYRIPLHVNGIPTQLGSLHIVVMWPTWLKNHHFRLFDVRYGKSIKKICRHAKFQVRSIKTSNELVKYYGKTCWWATLFSYKSS